MTRSTFAISLGALLLGACTTDKGGGGNTDTSTNSSDGDAFVDNDGDGYGSDEDCNDDDGTVHAGATEICDGIDNDCDGSVDEDVTQEFFRDADGDGFGDSENTEWACERPTGYVPNGNDCDDALADAYPGNTEICDGIDNDCNGTIDDSVLHTYYADTDGDGYGDPENAQDACAQPPGFVTDDSDCDDTTAQAFPGNLEICDEIDNNCDGRVDEGVTTTYYADTDSDGYGNAALSVEACALPTGYTATPGDCDDTVATTNPAATEYCDSVDNDCDGTTDEDDAVDAADWYADADTDGYGDLATTLHQCTQPSGYVSDNTDCDDTDAAEYPGADEYCDGDDDDCDGTIDETDSVDAADWYRDADSDAFGDAGTSLHQCYQPTGYVSDDTDCNDTTAAAYPGADEYCDGIDNDCDTYVDEDGEVLDGDTFYMDADSDGTGDPGTTIVACSVPSGYVDNAWDCDDTDGSEPVVVNKATGSSAGTGTLTSPLDSIQDGMDRAGQCVIVRQGTYRETLDFDGAAIDVWGVDGEDFTFIDADGVPCEGADPTGCEAAVTMNSGGSVAMSMHGFTVTGGTGHTESSVTTTTCADSSTSHGGVTECTVTVYEYCGGGFYVNGDDPNLYDLVVVDNTLPAFEQYAVDSGCAPGTGSCGYEQNWLYSYGGGLCLKDSAASLENVHVYENYADQGGGVYVGGSSVVTYDHSMLAENGAGDGGGINADGGNLSATNLIVAFNDADTDGGGIFTQNSGTSSFTNASFAYNASATGATRGDAAYVSTGTTVASMNSILHTSSANYVVYAAGTWSSSYSDVINAGSGSEMGGAASLSSTDMTASPSWVSVTNDGNYNNDDFALNVSSAAVNAGNPASSYNDTDGSRNDLGATGGPNGDGW